MATQAASNITNLKYHVISVEKTDPPQGMPDGNWYRYIIGQGRSKIEGVRNGTLKSVTSHARAFAENLNTRTKTGYSSYAPRSQKK